MKDDIINNCDRLNDFLRNIENPPFGYIIDRFEYNNDEILKESNLQNASK